MWLLSMPIIFYFPNDTNLIQCTRFPNLRLLDFRKIKTVHRREAIDLFKSKRGKDLLKEIAKKTKSNMPAFAAAETNNSKGLCDFD